MFFAQFTGSAAQGGRLTGIKHPFAMLVSEVYDRYLGYYGYSATKKDFRILLLLSYLAGPLVALAIPSIRKQRNYQLLALLTVLSFLTMAVIEGSRQRVYMVHTIPFLIVWLAISIHWLWSQGKWLRQLATLSVVVFALLHVAALAYRVRLDAYHKQYLPVVEYVRPTVRNGSLLIGPAPFLFELGFDAPLKFDPDLGAITGKQPALIVLDDQSRLTMQSQWAADPSRGAQARAVLDRYHLVFTHGEYEVYAPNTSR